MLGTNAQILMEFFFALSALASAPRVLWNLLAVPVITRMRGQGGPTAAVAEVAIRALEAGRRVISEVHTKFFL